MIFKMMRTTLITIIIIIMIIITTVINMSTAIYLLANTGTRSLRLAALLPEASLSVLSPVAAVVAVTVAVTVAPSLPLRETVSVAD